MLLRKTEIFRNFCIRRIEWVWEEGWRLALFQNSWREGDWPTLSYQDFVQGRERLLKLLVSYQSKQKKSKNRSNQSSHCHFCLFTMLSSKYNVNISRNCTVKCLFLLLFGEQCFWLLLLFIWGARKLLL